MSRCWRLGDRPALDGLRGVAVLSVLIGHLWRHGAANWFSGSGVVVFFVLSGFLITSLLLEELDGSGRLSLRRFYERRARRLAPALVVVLLFVAAAGLVVPSYANWTMFAGALTWSANWAKILQLHQAAGHQEYGTPLGHTWSLAVEEQFYLLWPVLLLLLARAGRRILVGATIVGVVVTGALAFLVSDPFHVYFGSDTRACPLLLGCLLAMWMHQRPEGMARPGVAAAALVSIVYLTLVGGHLSGAAPLLVALSTVALIWAATQQGGLRLLEPTWLRLVGRRSYALYLWHWPLYVLILRTLGGSWWYLALLGLPAAWVVSLLSWRYVEQRFLVRTPEPVTVSDPNRDLTSGDGTPRDGAVVA